jgi:hypothetical protein
VSACCDPSPSPPSPPLAADADADADADTSAVCEPAGSDEVDNDDDCSALTRRRLLRSPPEMDDDEAEEVEDEVMNPHAGPAATSASRSARDVNAIADTSAAHTKCKKSQGSEKRKY